MKELFDFIYLIYDEVKRIIGFVFTWILIIFALTGGGEIVIKLNILDKIIAILQNLQ